MRAIVTVVGQDRVGIIADVCALLAKNQINVLDISQTVMQDYFTMIMMVDTTAAEQPFAQLAQFLQEEGNGLGLSIHVQREDIFNAMLRI